MRLLRVRGVSNKIEKIRIPVTSFLQNEAETMNAEIGHLLQLSVPQKLEIVEELWDSIAATPESVPVPDWQKEELARRKAEYLQHPESGVPWEEAKERIRRGNG
jgi:putative addiction module component (TIGR02574 family)